MAKKSYVATRAIKHGKNRYELEDYGLTRAEVQEAYSTYLQRFGDLI